MEHISNMKTTIKGLYILKTICCITVVFLHATFPGVIGRFIVYFCRYPVPIFLMITGFFFVSSNFIKYEIKIFKYIFIGETVSLVTLLCLNNVNTLFKHSNIFDSPIKTLLIGPIFNGPLWYLYAVYYGILFLTIIDYCIHNMNKKITNIFIFIYMFVALFIQIYGRLFFYNVFSDFLRTAIFYALPFLLIGYFIKQNHLNMNLRKSFFLGCFGVILSIMEYLFYKSYLDVYIGTIFISISLFFIFLNTSYNNRLLEYIGRRLSDKIFILHAPVITIVSTFMNKSNYLFPVIVLVITAVIAIAIDYVFIGINFFRTRIDLVKRR